MTDASSSGNSQQAYVIHMARPEDLTRLTRHLRYVIRESGRGGSPHSSPARESDADPVRTGIEARWQRPLTDPLWTRTWLLWSGPVDSDRTTVVGHLDLRGGRVHAELHRAVLGMGIQREHTRRGLGRRLVEVAIAWARDEAHLEWLDLGVFANNHPARRLYARMGFRETGRVPDAFRIEDGPCVEDILMTLPLRD